MNLIKPRPRGKREQSLTFWEQVRADIKSLHILALDAWHNLERHYQALLYFGGALLVFAGIITFFAPLRPTGIVKVLIRMYGIVVFGLGAAIYWIAILHFGVQKGKLKHPRHWFS